ncbi:MAG: tetratricopeptide repeat protein, partial [Pseudomonadota bacterium]
MTERTFSSAHPQSTLEPAALVEVALDAIRAGRFDEAETQLRRVLEGFPEHPAATHFLGILRHRQGRSDEGVVLVQQSIALAPAM